MRRGNGACKHLAPVALEQKNGGIRIAGPDNSGSNSSTLKLTTCCDTFSGGAFFIVMTPCQRTPSETFGQRLAVTWV